MIVLDSDVAAVFKTTESVNQVEQLSPQCPRWKKVLTEFCILFHNPCNPSSKFTNHTTTFRHLYNRRRSKCT